MTLLDRKNIPVRFLKHVLSHPSATASMTCITEYAFEYNAIVNHHQTSFSIAFALTDCDIHIQACHDEYV